MERVLKKNKRKTPFFSPISIKQCAMYFQCYKKKHEQCQIHTDGGVLHQKKEKHSSKKHRQRNVCQSLLQCSFCSSSKGKATQDMFLRTLSALYCEYSTFSICSNMHQPHSLCYFHNLMKKIFLFTFPCVRLPVQKLIPSLVLLFAFQISTKKSHSCGPFQKLVRSSREVQM